MNIAPQKTALRTQMRALRNALSTQEQTGFSQHIQRHLRELSAVQNAQTVAAFLAMRHEANLDEAIFGWLESKTVVVPALGLKPRFAVLESLANTKTNARGLRVPLSESKIAAENCDVILVPALAFDHLGNRLGQGGGWYDKALERARRNPNIVVVGVCFSCQIVENVPHDERDQSVDFVVTEDRVLDLRANEV